MTTSTVKKFLPKTYSSIQGFTLIELLVVVTIIAILSAIGITAFGRISANARDAKRKADIEAIAKAYEKNYNWATGKYPVLIDTDFTAKKKPIPPEGGTYDGLLSTADTSSFTVCARLETNQALTVCTDTSATCYCQSSALGITTGAGASSNCPTTITSGTICNATGVPVGTTTVYFCPPTNISCAGGSPGSSTPIYNGNYYSAASGGNVAGTVTVYKQFEGPGSTNTISAVARTTNP